jgi:signal transduction histidine kinase/CheY-like chemotaxis protein
MLKRWERSSIPQVDVRLWNGSYVRLIDKRTPQGDTVCLGVDITSTIRRERQLQRARDAALAASQAKSTFLANMSHEIRTPMNGVVSMAELLGETDLDPNQKLYADTIRHSGEALLVIINDILDYSKIEAGKLILHEVEFDLLEVILEIFGLLRPGTEDRDLDFKLHIDVPRIDRLIGDCGRLRQILFNLIGNAVKFTETGHVRVDVTCDGEAADEEMALRMSVEDTGIGIAPEMQAHVFGEFNQVEENKNRSHDGTGLGLAITKRLVTMMGGEVTLRSAPGQGSTFVVTMTLRRATPLAGAAPQLPEGKRNVWLIGPIFSERARDLLNGLLRLGANVQSSTRATPPEAPFPDAAVILLSEADAAGVDPEALHNVLRGAPVFHLCDDPEGVLTGAIHLNPPETDEALLENLIGPGDREDGPEGDARDPPPTPKRLRLLAAEDNKTNQLVFRTMLKALDLDLTLVADGAALFEAYKDRRPDIVFTDISMPGMDGLEATSLIRAHEAVTGRPPVPIIAMTAHTVIGDRDRFLKQGMDDVLTKPLKKDALLDRIATYAPDGGA